LTLDQLVVLDAIARTGSFARAGKELFRVPSAISYTVKNLEQALDIPLFDRTGRTATLTPEGTRLLESARDLLARAESLERLAGQLRGGWEPELRVVVDGSLPMAPITRCLRAFASPDIPTRVRLDVEYQEGVVDRFEAERGHLMLMLGFAGDGDDQGYDATPLPPLELALVVAPTHPLAAASAPTLHTVADHLEVVVRDSSPKYTRSPKRSFLGTRDVLYLSDFHSKRLALVDGTGFGWVPLHLVSEDLQEGRLQRLAVDGRSSWTYAPQLVTRKGEALGRAGQLFVQVLHESSNNLT
jgi:DNA-binding transcriptional LysR family regulator